MRPACRGCLEAPLLSSRGWQGAARCQHARSRAALWTSQAALRWIERLQQAAEPTALGAPGVGPRLLWCVSPRPIVKQAVCRGQRVYASQGEGKRLMPCGGGGLVPEQPPVAPAAAAGMGRSPLAAQVSSSVWSPHVQEVCPFAALASIPLLYCTAVFALAALLLYVLARCRRTLHATPCQHTIRRSLSPLRILLILAFRCTHTSTEARGHD